MFHKCKISKYNKVSTFPYPSPFSYCFMTITVIHYQQMPNGMGRDSEKIELQDSLRTGKGLDQP